MIRYDRVGTGEPLVLIHGIGSNRHAWDTILPFLTDKFDVIAIDLPGFGESPEFEGGATVSAAELAGSVRDLCESIGVDRPHVAGNSLGGWVALELARMDAASSATGICPAGLWKSVPSYTLGILRFNRRVSRRLDRSLELISGIPGSRAAVAQVYGKPWKVPRAAMVAEIRELGQSPGFDRVLASFPEERFFGGRTIDVPVTIAVGSRDVMLRRGCRERDQLPAHTEWLTLPGCGHVPMFDDPEAVASAIIRGAVRR